jgi:8-oxo-dGTP diphosphatase
MSRELSKPATKKSADSKPPRVGVGVLLWKGDCLLLGQRIAEQAAPCWQFPGGRLEAGESVLECAAREVREETGLTIGSARPAGFSNQLFTMAERDYVTLYVSAAHLSGEPEVKEPDKCLGWQWFDYRQLPDPLFPPISYLLKQTPDLSEFRVVGEIRANAQK